MPDSKLQYPNGKFIFDENVTNEYRKIFIKEIELLPGKLNNAVSGLNNEQLDTPYRKNGWTIRQVIHHIPDSHMNAYIRFKLALTENQPTIKTYDENEWAKLRDYSQTPIEVSLALIKAIHTRWIILLNSLQEKDFRKKLNHPDWGLIPLDYILSQYAWHGNHHVAHITSLRKRMDW